MKDEQIFAMEEQWGTLKEEYGAEAFLYIPVPVIYSRSFADAEYITEELGRFIYKEKIIGKTNPGHADYLAFSVPYRPCMDQDFSVVQNLYNHIRNAGGYYGAYRGILLVDISEWCGHFRDKHFDIILSYLSDQRENGIISFFYADCGECGADRHVLEAVLSPYFSSFTVCYGTDELFGYAVSLMEGEGILLEGDAGRYLEDFIRESLRSELFHGTESVRRVCEGVARRYRTSQGRATIDGPHLKAAIKDLGYEGIYKERPAKVIGFR